MRRYAPRPLWQSWTTAATFWLSAAAIGEKKYDLGFNRATSPHQTGSTMKPIGAYALALDYKLINYSSQILDSPYYSAEDKKVLKDQYIGVMSPIPRLPSPAAMCGAPGRRTTAV